MNLEQLIKTDLNLLVTFQLLMEERSVSRAASRMHVTQPAVSKTLKRLRELFEDPLFTKTTQGLAPTAKASYLHQQLPDILNRVNQFLNIGPFDPRQYQGSIHVASSDFVALYVPRLLEKLHTEAPGLKLRISAVSVDFLNKLNDGSIDFVLHPSTPTQNESIISNHVTSANRKCVISERHPLADQSELSLENYLNYPHIRHISNFPHKDFAVVDTKLAKLGRKRNIILETEFLDIALRCAESTNAFITGPDTFIRSSHAQQSFRVLKLPSEITNSEIPLHIYYHSRIESSAAHLWIRDKIIAMLKEIFE